MLLDRLGILVDQSLLRQIAPDRDEPRFAMLETIREYATERLAASGEMATYQDAHAAYFLALAEAAEPELQGAGQLAWLDRLEQEHDNLRAALRWALERGATETAVRLAGALHWFWFMRGHFSEGRAWLEQALALGGAISPHARSKALSGVGMLVWRQGDLARAAALLQEGANLARAAGDRAGLGYALHHLAHVREQQGDAGDAIGLYEESLALFQQPDQPWGRALTLTCLGEALHRQGDDERATPLLEEGLARWRALGDRHGIADALLLLGLVAQQRGRTGARRRASRRACSSGGRWGISRGSPAPWPSWPPWRCGGATTTGRRPSTRRAWPCAGTSARSRVSPSPWRVWMMWPGRAATIRGSPWPPPSPHADGPTSGASPSASPGRTRLRIPAPSGSPAHSVPGTPYCRHTALMTTDARPDDQPNPATTAARDENGPALSAAITTPSPRRYGARRAGDAPPGSAAAAEPGLWIIAMSPSPPAAASSTRCPSP